MSPRRLHEIVQTVDDGDTLADLVDKLPRRFGRAARITTIPPDDLPRLSCPACDALLTFIRSTVGGVVPIEQWDTFACRRCGSGYDYRRRTRKLTRVA